MDEGLCGMLVLVGVAATVSLGVHLVVRRFLVACLVAAGGASIVFQVLAYLRLGYVDPFVVVALVTGTGVAFVVSLVVGLALRWMRRREEAGGD